MMKKILSLLLVVLMMTGAIAYATVAFAQSNDEYSRTAAAIEETVTPAAQEAAEAENPPVESPADDGNIPSDGDEPETVDDSPLSDIDFSAMTPQELYEYLLTLESDEEIQVVLSLLTTEQLAALEAYRQAMEEGETAEDLVAPAINYTKAGPLLDPVVLPSLLKARSFSGQTMDAAAEEDELILSKAVSSSNGGYKLTLEAYATGEVRITTGNPLPTDIIMVLDVSGSMNSNMSDGIKRIAALKTAANNFINSVADMATSELNHRIAVVTYDNNSTIISGNGAASGAFVNAYNNSSGIAGLKSSISGLSAGGSQGAVAGLNSAISIFQQAPFSGTRNRVVVYLTGGTPKGDEVDAAIQKARILKAAPSDGCGATVYSIGVFDGADPTVTILSSGNDDNDLMHFISSNYPNATGLEAPGSGGSNAGYYLSASNAAKLNEIFQNIADRVEGGTTVTLDEVAIVKDILSPYFTLPAGADTSSIKLYTAGVVQNSTTLAWQPPVLFNGGAVTISPDGKTIGVSGFDYSEQFVAPVKTDGVITGYRGTKLIIEIPIVYKQGSCFGGTVPTNTGASGIYNGDDLVEALPIPTVNIPVNYDFTPVNQSIYLTQAAMLNNMFTTEAGYIADGVNNAYVRIVYTIRSGGGTVLGTYTIPAGQTGGEWNISHFALEGLTANTGYTVGCTITPVSGPVSPLSLSRTATVYVFTPEVTWQDSVIYLGETADYDDNLYSTMWKNAVDGVQLPAGVAPTLAYQFTPDATAFARDTHVGVAVKIGSFNMTPYTHFVHKECAVPGCAYNAAQGQFMVHVRSCSLTITKQGADDSTDTFIFKVTGGGRTLYVSVQGNGSQTIVGLPVGSYTVTEQSEWSWRYTAGEKQVTLDASHASATVTVNNTKTNDKWLGGDSHVVNTFPNAG